MLILTENLVAAYDVEIQCIVSSLSCKKCLHTLFIAFLFFFFEPETTISLSVAR